MIPLFPYWKFIILSSLSQQEAAARLSSMVASKPQRFKLSLWWETIPQEFTGTCSENEFRIERVIQYRNSFLPTIYGRFLPTETGLQIRIVMTLSPLILILAVWLSLCALPILVSVITGLITLGHLDQALKTPLQVVAFVYLMFTGGFAYEAVTARRFLERLFESE
jgi:hypothetical protein